MTRSIKYLTPFLLFFLGYLSFTRTGLIVWLPLIYSFGLIPFIELFISPDAKNLEKAEEDMAKNDIKYDLILYLVFIFQYILLWLFLSRLSQSNLSSIDIIGRTISMGLLCGIFGINVAHELGHRVNGLEQFLAKSLLLTSLYVHFFIEHNKGHHKNVSTPIDPSSAKLNESLYAFLPQTLIGTYMGAWKISISEAKKKKRFFNINNEMFYFQIIQCGFLLLIYLAFGLNSMMLFLLSAFIGALLLESVNYIEHYGLKRIKTGENIYERVLPTHSWNSDHIMGRLLLFELSRHSDHHYMASRKYQILRNFEHSPQMPTGYPGMILLSLIPPFWFRVMHKRLQEFNSKAE